MSFAGFSATQCLVVNVEYRLAPEYKFPTAFDDGCTVTRWIIDNKTTVGEHFNSQTDALAIETYRPSVALKAPKLGGYRVRIPNNMENRTVIHDTAWSSQIFLRT